MGRNRSLFVLVYSNGSFWVIVGLYVFLMDSNVSLRVLIVSFAPLWILMGPDGSL